MTCSESTAPARYALRLRTSPIIRIGNVAQSVLLTVDLLGRKVLRRSAFEQFSREPETRLQSSTLRLLRLFGESWAHRLNPYSWLEVFTSSLSYGPVGSAGLPRPGGVAKIVRSFGVDKLDAKSDDFLPQRMHQAISCLWTSSRGRGQYPVPCLKIN